MAGPHQAPGVHQRHQGDSQESAAVSRGEAGRVRAFHAGAGAEGWCRLGDDYQTGQESEQGREEACTVVLTHLQVG